MENKSSDKSIICENLLPQEAFDFFVEQISISEKNGFTGIDILLFKSMFVFGLSHSFNFISNRCCEMSANALDDYNSLISFKEKLDDMISEVRNDFNNIKYNE